VGLVSDIRPISLYLVTELQASSRPLLTSHSSRSKAFLRVENLSGQSNVFATREPIGQSSVLKCIKKKQGNGIGFYDQRQRHGSEGRRRPQRHRSHQGGYRHSRKLT